MDHVLEEIVPYLPEKTAKAVASLTEREQRDLREIRIQMNNPTFFYSGFGRQILPDTVSSKSELESVFRKICASSAYSHRNEIRAGFVTIPGGHRVGIVGTAVLGEGGRVESVRDVSGLSFRIARDHSIDLDEILPRICRDDRIRNLMLLGPPCSGKTTVLRELARALSKGVQVAVIDEREEIFPSSRPVPIGCDVLRGYPKSVGILQALRTLSPKVILCDEVGTAAEVSAMLDGLRSGVSLVVSAHAYSAEELMQRPPVRELFVAGGIDVAAFLDPVRVGTVREIKEREDLCVEMFSSDAGISDLCGMRSDLRAGSLCPTPSNS